MKPLWFIAGIYAGLAISLATAIAIDPDTRHDRDLWVFPAVFATACAVITYIGCALL